jgi:phosphopantetheine adenylyltransferase
MANDNGNKGLLSDMDYSRFVTPKEEAAVQQGSDIDYSKFMDVPEEGQRSGTDYSKYLPSVSPEAHRVVAETSTPDGEAETYSNAELGGITPELARKSPEAAKHRAEFQQIENFLKEWDAKGTEKALQDPLFMASARDDVEALVGVERTIRSFPSINEQRRIMGVDPTPLAGDRSLGTEFGGLTIASDFMKGVEQGQQTVALGKLGSELGYAHMFGGNKQEIEDRIEQFRANSIIPPSGRGYFESAGQLAPVMGEVIKEGHMTGAKFGLGGMGLAALTSAFFPPAAPVAPISIPAAGVTMYGAGVKIGAYESMFTLEYGNAFLEFLEMRDENGDFLDPSIANGAALGVGVINASLEFIGLKFVAGMFGNTGRKLLGDFSKRTVKKALQNKSTRAAIQAALGKYALGVGGESTTEAAQEIANILIGVMGKDIQDHLRGYVDLWGNEILRKKLDPENVKTFLAENLPRVMEAFEVAAKGTAVIGGLGFNVSAVSRVRRARANAELAENFERQQKEIAEKTAETLSAERNPTMYQAFLEEHMGLKGQQAYIDGDEIIELEQNSPEVIEEMVKHSGQTKAEILESAKNGQALGISLSAFHARLTPETQNKLFKHIKPTPSGYSVAQVQEGLIMAEEVFEDQFNGFIIEEENIDRELDRIEKVVFDRIGDPAHAASVASALYSMAKRLHPKDASVFLKKMDMNNAEFRQMVELGTVDTLEAIQTEITTKTRQVAHLEELIASDKRGEERRAKDRRQATKQFEGEEQRKSRERRLEENRKRPPIEDQIVTMEEELAILERKLARIEASKPKGNPLDQTPIGEIEIERQEFFQEEGRGSWQDRVILPHQEEAEHREPKDSSLQNIVSMYLENMFDNGEDVNYDNFDAMFDAAKRGAYDWAESWWKDPKWSYDRQQKLLKVKKGAFLKKEPKTLFQEGQDPDTISTSQDVDIFGTVNNRLSKELEIVERLLGPVETAKEDMFGIGKGKDQQKIRSIRAYDLGAALFKAKKNGKLKRLMDPKVSPDTLADELGYKGKKRVKFKEELSELRSGDPTTIETKGGRPVLSDNGKATASVDLILGFCQPTAPCSDCYAARSMNRMSHARKAMRNSINLLLDPKAFGRDVAAESKRIPKSELPFIRLLGSGDMTNTETVTAFNELAKHADRPIHIFSRHHENLGKLKGNQDAPFIKMGSIDLQLFDHYGLKYLSENMEKRGITNAYLYSGGEMQDTHLRELERMKSLGLILSTGKNVHDGLPFGLHKRGCPCDAEERSYMGSCRQCALSMAGCFTAFVDKGTDSKGKMWKITNPKAPKGLRPVLSFMNGYKPEGGISSEQEAYQKIVHDVVGKSIGLIKLNLNGYLGTIDKKTGKRNAPTKNNVVLKDIRWPDDKIRLHDKKRWLANEKKKVKARQAKIKAGKMKKPYVAKPLPESTRSDLYLDQAEILSMVQTEIKRLQGIQENATKGDLYLVGGVIQPPVAYRLGKKLGQPELLSKEEAQSIGAPPQLFQTEAEPTLELGLEDISLSGEEVYTTVEEAAAHNAKVEILEKLQEGGLLDGDVLYAIEGVKIADWDTDQIEYALERIGDKRYVEEIYKDHLENVEDEKVEDIVLEEFSPPTSLEEWAVLGLGTTEDLEEAGYILSDGRMLDLSGKREGGMGGRREMDHRQLPLPTKGSISGTDLMSAFMKQTGAIRMDGNSGLLDMEVSPTPEQLGRIQELFDKNGVVFLDLQDGKRRKYVTVHNPKKMAGTIRRFYAGAEIAETELFQAAQTEPHEVFYLKRGFTKQGLETDIEVIKNPTIQDYQALKKEFRKEYPERGDTPAIRTTFDNKGNKYIWLSPYAVHAVVEPQINRMFNVKTNQTEGLFQTEPRKVQGIKGKPNFVGENLKYENIAGKSKKVAQTWKVEGVDGIELGRVGIRTWNKSKNEWYYKSGWKIWISDPKRWSDKDFAHQFPDSPDGGWTNLKQAQKGLLEYIEKHDKQNEHEYFQSAMETEQQVVRLYNDLANLQRGAPEQAMLRIAKSDISQIFQHTAEHVGDIMHRMNEHIDLYEGSHAIPKIRNMLRTLESSYGFEREAFEQIESNLEYFQGQGKWEGATVEGKKEELRQLSLAYAAEHKKLPVYNRAQALAQEAAVALGEWRFDDSRLALSRLQREVDKGRDNWKRFIMESPQELEQSVFHGTPHTLEAEEGFPHGRLRLDKIGTGEGAQAYGWGIYLADVADVAKSYTPRDDAYEALLRSAYDHAIKLELFFAAEVYEQAMLHDTVKELEEKFLTEDYKEGREEIKRAIAQVSKATEDVGFSLYELDIPDEMIPKMLEWDSKLKDQPMDFEKLIPPKNAETLIKKWESVTEEKWDMRHLGGSKSLAESFYEQTGEEFYHMMVGIYSFDKNLHIIDRTEAAEKVSKWLNSLGIVGQSYLDQESRTQTPSDRERGIPQTYNHVIWDQATLDQVSLLERNSQTLDAVQELEQAVIQSQRRKPPKGSLVILPDGYLINLFERADRSTPFHELAHAYLLELRSIVDSGSGTPEMVAEIETIDKWLAELDDKMTLAEEFHKYTPKQFEGRSFSDLSAAEVKIVRDILKQERFARGFEVYLFEGKAPTQELVPAFQRFYRWMKEIYGKIASLGVELTPEMREIYGRMMTVEQSVDEAAATVGFEMMSEAQMKELGVMGEDMAYMQKLYDAALESAESKMYKAIHSGIKTNMEDWVKEAEDQADRNTMHDLVDSLNKGQGLDAAFAERTWGKAVRDRLPKGLKNIFKRGGVNPDDFAAENGYESAEQMLDALEAYIPRKQEIENFIKQKKIDFENSFTAEDFLLETKEYSEYLGIVANYTEGKLSAEAQVSEFVKSAGKPRKTALARSAFKTYARNLISNMSLREATRTDKFIGAIKKAADAEKKAINKKDWVSAKRANEQMRLNVEMALESRKIRTQEEKYLRYVKRIKKMKPQRVDKAYLGAMLNLVQRFSPVNLTQEHLTIMESAGDIESLMSDQFDVMGPDSYGFDPFLTKSSEPYNYRDLTSEGLNELNVLTKALEKKGRSLISNILTSLDKSLDVVVEELKTVSEGLWDRPRWKKYGKTFFGMDARAGLRKIQDRMHKHYADTYQLWAMIRILDDFQYYRDNTQGPWEVYLRDNLEKAYAKKAVDIRKYRPKIEEAFANLIQRGSRLHENLGRTIPTPRTEGMIKDNRAWDFEAIATVALNMGNESNMQRLMDGFGWTENDVSNVVRQLTDQEWDAIQEIWDLFEEMRPEFFDAAERVNHIAPPRIPAKAFTTPTGKVMRGGYVPVVYDPLSKRGKDIDQMDLMKDAAESAFMRPSVNAKATKARMKTGGGQPLNLYFYGISRQFEYNLQYTAFAETIKDISRILNDPEIHDILFKKVGPEWIDTMKEVLAFTANPARLGRQKEATVLMQQMGRRASNYILGLNRSVGVKQLFSIPQFYTESGSWHSGLMVLFNPIRAFNDMFDESPSMYARFSDAAVDREVKRQRQAIRIAGKYKFLPDEALDFVLYTYIRFFDALAVLPAYYGTRKLMERKYGSGARAIRETEKIIIDTQPMSREMDLSTMQLERNTLSRLFTFFTGFLMRMENLGRIYGRGILESKIPKKRALKYILLARVLPPMAMNLLFTAGAGDEPDERAAPAQKLIDITFRREVLFDLLLYQTAGFPVVRQLTELTVGAVRLATEPDYKWYSAFQTPMGTIPDAIEWNMNTVARFFAGEKEVSDFALALTDMMLIMYRGANLVGQYEKMEESVKQFGEAEGFDAFFKLGVKPNPKHR